MNNLILIATILFWVVVYVLEGLHDINVVRSSDFNKSKEMTNWHFYDSIMFAVIHLAIALFFYATTKDICLFFLQLAFSLAIRVSTHETMMNLVLHNDFWHRPTSKHNPFDIWLSAKSNTIIFIYRYGLLLFCLALYILAIMFNYF